MTQLLSSYINELNDIAVDIFNDKTLDYKMSAIIDIINQSKTNKKIIIIGNGGSASIASHTAIDLWKNAGIKAITFNEASLLTCISNDFGYEQVFEKPIEMFAEKRDILIAISSSGMSRNIINGLKKAKEKGCITITMTGFEPDNILKTLGDINLYVPSTSYGYVELSHSILCHYISDTLSMEKIHG